MAPTSSLLRLLPLALVAVLLSPAAADKFKCPRYHDMYHVQVFSQAAAHRHGLSHIVQKYKHALGGVDNGNTPGPLHRGQRSINWDAAGVPFDMPFDFFNRLVTRGAIFHAKHNEFRVSNTNNASDIDDRFNSIIPHSASKQFQRFSPLRLFTPLKRNRVKVLFRVPASDNRAVVPGFAAVFTDVDLKDATSLRFFDKDGCLIARLPVKPQNKGLSFAGVIVRNRKWRQVPVIAKVTIKLGTVSFARFPKLSHDKRRSADLVALDDLFYGEPRKMH